MELEENSKFQKLLRGSSFATGNIIFDDEEIIIQRDSKAFWYSFAIALFILLQPVVVLIWGTDGSRESMYNYQLFLLFVGIAMLFFSFFKIMEIRNTSNVAFPIRDLKSVALVSREKSFIRISIQLSDSRKTSVTVHNDSYFRDFMDTLKRHNVEIK
ncbi:MAG: hypothetical protein H6536_00945 [Bacteroidales bacterium]|nr:hypothetical protein [Bacteroidales bacterium]